ncbi:MAG TPA: AI-2E family transporter [Burkholderiales bacterium]|nr:AI-2E family transporter [Burkholderiales bacterium]
MTAANGAASVARVMGGPGPVAWAGIFAATCLLLVALNHILWLVVPALMALVLSYVLDPPVRRLMYAGVGREAAAALVTSVFLVFLMAATLALLAWAGARAEDWQAGVERYLRGGAAMLERTLEALEVRWPALARANLAGGVTTWLNEYSNTFVERQVQPLAVSILAWLPAALLGPFFAFFILRDGRRFHRFLVRAVPNAYFEKTLDLLHEMHSTGRSYFTGLMKLTVLDTLALGIGLWLLGLPGAWLLALIAAVLAWVPYVGSIAGCVLVVLVAATDFPHAPTIAYWSIMLFILVRLLDDFVFMPATVGKHLNLHPLVSVLMLFVGGAVAGVPGLALVLPLLGVAAVVGTALSEIVTDRRLRARHAYARQLRAAQAAADLS